MVISVLLPSPQVSIPRGIYDRTTRGVRLYLATPRLRGLLALNFAAASARAIVLVNTVVLVKSDLGLGNAQVAMALGAFGGESVLAALGLPHLLEVRPDRPVMIAGASCLIVVMLGLALGMALSGPTWKLLLVGWIAIGIDYSAILTPSGRLLKRSTNPEDRPAVYAAQFALSHACWLLTYPLSGWLITAFGPVISLICLALVAGLGLLSCIFLWPPEQDRAIEHTHNDLPKDHPHLECALIHSHPIVIDDYHPDLLP